jgi:uncharacterized membrane protein YdcZ (DUF606 family)
MVIFIHHSYIRGLFEGGLAMNYFQVLSFAFGIVLILTRPAIQFFPKQWNAFELNIAYTEKQPRWVWFIGLLGISLVAFTWYKHLTAEVPYSLVITLLLTLTLVKMSQVLFNYQQFRAFVVKVLEKDRKTLALINLFALILGIASLLMGFLLY